MKKKQLVIISGIFLMIGAAAAFAQTYQEPSGGASKNIGGKWKCGKLGTLTLTDKDGNVTGKYTSGRGTVTGQVRDNVFEGSWSEGSGMGKNGTLKLQISTRTMTAKPTHLEGSKFFQGVMRIDSLLCTR